MLNAFFLFVFSAAAFFVLWNKFFTRVPTLIGASFVLICVVYQANTLLTDHVDLPGNLAFVAYPWRATGRPPVKANTGIIFTQIAPWTRVARDALTRGEWPLWNRDAACGAPLLANQQTAIFHPFTVLGLLLSLGKAFTLSVSLRIFCVLFFTFVFLRQWEVTTSAAYFGAVAYTFSTFHIVWLLFPLGLSTMMLPACFVGINEITRACRPAAYIFLVSALSSSVLGGHPESALWVWIIAISYVLYVSLTHFDRWRKRMASVAVISSTFAFAMLLTAFYWLPALYALKQTTRYELMHLSSANPPKHGLSYEWLLPILAPNALGTPQDGTYVPPQGSHAAVPNDYGEVASSYAGLLSLAFALASVFTGRKRPLAFAVGTMLFAFLTFAEVPGWRDVLHMIPLVGISLHQRLRFAWNLGVCVSAALALDAIGRGESRKPAIAALLCCAVGVILIYVVRKPLFLWTSERALLQALIPVVTVVGVAFLLRRQHARTTAIVTILVFVDLIVATYRYNPTSSQRDIYPVTGAIATLKRQPKPFRIAAVGWSFLPDTASYYDLEDVKTTDPVQNAKYMRLLKGYLNVVPDSYDLLIRDVSQPFFDYLSIRYVYIPPDQTLRDSRFVERYRGPDGVVLENLSALPRYFLVSSYIVRHDFDQAVWASKQISNYLSVAIVDHVPESAPPNLRFTNRSIELQGGNVRLRRYSANETVLDVESHGWNLLVTSDVNWPGWNASANGTRLPVVTVNGAFLGCFVPPGPSILTLRYRPIEFSTSLAVGIGSLVFLSGILVVWWARARKHRPLATEGQR